MAKAIRGLSTGFWVGIGAAIALVPGCVAPQSPAGGASPGIGGQELRPAGNYCLRCPDIVDVTIDGRPDLSGKRTVGPDGRIELRGDRVRVEGHTPSDGVFLVAAEARAEPYQVQLHVAEFNSQQLYIFGPRPGAQHAVPYRGPETVAELLQRTGTATAEAAPNKIYVVRPRIGEGQPPEVFPIHLHAGLTRKDEGASLRLQPYDQVYIGETRRSNVGRCLAPCLRPVYDFLCGLRGADSTNNDKETPNRISPAISNNAPTDTSNSAPTGRQMPRGQVPRLPAATN